MKLYIRIYIAVFIFSLPSINSAQVGNFKFQQTSSSIIQAILDSVNVDSLYYTERHLTGEKTFLINGKVDSIKTRYSLSPGIYKAQEYLQYRFEKMGYNVELQPFNLGDYIPNNIIVSKQGTVTPSRIFILCAHYDSTSPLALSEAPGADDNGSGTAAIVEAARVLRNMSFQYSIYFLLFAGEEQGLYGSDFYARQASKNDLNIAGVINLDMIGYDGNGDGVFEIHTGYKTESQNIGNIVSDNVTNFNLFLDPQILQDSASTTRSDHSSFWTWNYPAILVIEDFFDSSDQYPFYHSTNDVISKLNPIFFLNMARLSIASLATLANVDTIASNIPVAPTIPNKIILYSPYPNPFNQSVNIEYQVSSFDNISIKIFDSSGRIVTTLFEGHQNPGKYLLTWNGSNSNGSITSSGIYFVSFQSGNFWDKKKIILMK